MHKTSKTLTVLISPACVRLPGREDLKSHDHASHVMFPDDITVTMFPGHS